MIEWTCKKFTDLSPSELYEIMKLRAAVFVVEQKCAYQDADGKDSNAHHVMGYDEQKSLIAYSRILPAGVSYNEPSIGRVVSATNYRGKGIGKELMKETMRALKTMYGNVPVRISAQCYLLKFYTDLNFKIVGNEYLEDNIPHCEMLFTP
jgi:ElaA protein